MKPYLYLAAAVLTVASLQINAEGVKKKEIPGNFYYSGGSLYGTVILTPDQICSKRGQGYTKSEPAGEWNAPVDAAPDAGFAHAVPGTWRFHQGKQRLVLRFPDAVFTGTVVNVNLITGTYTRVGMQQVEGTLTRTDATIFHVIVNRLDRTMMYGGVMFNPTNKFPYADYRIAVYSWTAGLGTLELNNGKTTQPLKKLSMLQSRLTRGYESAYAFLVSAAFTPPATIAAPLPVDGVNVFAYDWQTNGFKWFDWSTTNDPSVF